MPEVAALYRYPVKGFTPEPREAIAVRGDGRVAGDRVLAFRFASTEAPDAAWTPKAGMLVLMNTPALARLTLRFDEAARHLWLWEGDALLAEGGLGPAERSRLADAVAGWALAQGDSPLAGHPERLPLRLVGDGATPRYHDNEAGEVTLHGRASVASLAGALGLEGADERRFRSNIVVEGAGPWEELDWVGRRLRVGDAELLVDRRKGRCLATHANPVTGVRDTPVMTTLTRTFGQEQPTFAVALRVLVPGAVRVGDPVVVLE